MTIERKLASEEQKAKARDLFATDDVQIDEDAWVSECDDGAYWVQAWVLVDENRDKDDEDLLDDSKV